jgi:hypothetical protein
LPRHQQTDAVERELCSYEIEIYAYYETTLLRDTFLNSACLQPHLLLKGAMSMTDVELGPIPRAGRKELSEALKSLHTLFTETIRKIYPRKVPVEVRRLQETLDDALRQLDRLRFEQCAIHSLECTHGIASKFRRSSGDTLTLTTGNTTLFLTPHWTFWRPEQLQSTNTDRILSATSFFIYQSDKLLIFLLIEGYTRAS